ncbi:putative exopolyphosphatase [Tanacetum coccineum]
MVTPIYFSKFAMNCLKLDKITKADLKNPEGDRFPYDLSKPLPLQGSPGHFTFLVDFFFNNNLEYLRTGNSERKYTTSITKTKAAKFSKLDVYSTMKILSVVSVKVDKQFGYGYLQEIVVRRADYKLYTFKEGDFPKLHLNDIEEMLLLHVQNKLFNLDGNDVIDLAVALCMFTRRIVIQKRVEDVQLGVSLKLGHVTLTQKFIGNKAVGAMREYIRNVVKESRLVEKVEGEKIDLVIGSSGSIKMIKKLSKEELRELIEKLCDDKVDGKVFKKRSAFILAAVVLMDEIFELFGIKEIEVSGFPLEEGVIAKKLGIFTGLIKRGEIGERNEVLLDDKDLEYIEAACLLHNIGLINGKKGYHKRSYHIIMNGENLNGYNAEKIKIIVLLARHHRKKILKLNHDSLSEFTDEMKHKMSFLYNHLSLCS